MISSTSSTSITTLALLLILSLTAELNGGGVAFAFAIPCHSCPSSRSRSSTSAAIVCKSAPAGGAADDTPPSSSVVEEDDPKAQYPFTWAKDNGQFSTVPKSKEEQNIDNSKFPGPRGFVRKLLRRQKKYVFYVRNEDEERYARVVVSTDKTANEKKENVFHLKLWKIPLKWVKSTETEDIKSVYKVSPGATKQIVVTAKDKEAYVSMWVSYEKPKSLLTFLIGNDVGLFFNAAKNVPLDMTTMNYALRKKQFKYNGEQLYKYSNINRRFEAKK